MFDFIIFLRDRFISIGNFLDKYSFPVGGITVSLLDIFIGFIAMGIIISVFWKGAKS